MIRTAFLPAFSAFCALSSAALAVPVAVNIDINRLSSNATYEGDDGALSAEGGTFWNAVPALVQSQNGIENLKDEAGRVTAVRYSVPRYAAGSQSGGNALFDSGLGWCCDLDAPISRVSGLVAGRTYDLCVYAPLNGTADLTVTHAGGQIAREVTGFSTAFAPSFVMPGTEGTDYHLFTGIQPYDTGGGNYGFDVSFLPQERQLHVFQPYVRSAARSRRCRRSPIGAPSISTRRTM
ncbi:MAG: hypothetical protein R3F11_23375 [Verrucomicrobiales bacterium]